MAIAATSSCAPMPVSAGGDNSAALVQLEQAVQQLSAAVEQLRASIPVQAAVAGSESIGAPVGVPAAAVTAAAVGAAAAPVSAAAPAAPALVAAPALGQRIVEEAYRHLGKPYVANTAGPETFDCSGLIVHVMRQLGIKLPHKASLQATHGVAVERSQLQPGDLVYFQGDGKDEVSHIGIYVGNDQFLHAPKTGDVVRVSSLSSDWAQRTYRGARRIG